MVVHFYIFIHIIQTFCFCHDNSKLKSVWTTGLQEEEKKKKKMIINKPDVKLPWSHVDRTGHESPGEDYGWPYQTSGVNR